LTGGNAAARGCWKAYGRTDRRTCINEFLEFTDFHT